MKPIIILSSILLLFSCNNRIKETTQWGAIYKNYGIDSASFEILEQSKERVFFYNKQRGNTRTSPASTFKIFLSLIALETSVAPDQDLVIKYNGVPTYNPLWNKDMDMREAFITSSEPYYQELAKRIGKVEMQKWIDTCKYGNRIIGDDVEHFWTNGALQITPDEQVGLMKRLYFDDLPFSKRTMRIVRSLMLQEESNNCRMYYKSGVAVNGKNYGCWLVGFVEDSANHPYFFANHFDVDTSVSIDSIRLWRMATTKDIFKEFGVSLK